MIDDLGDVLLRSSKGNSNGVAEIASYLRSRIAIVQQLPNKRCRRIADHNAVMVLVNEDHPIFKGEWDN